MRNARSFAAIAMLGVMLAAPVTAPGSEKQSAEDPGKTLYRRYCASCHGVSAKGDGPLAGVLKTPPTDLTRIARDAGGTFPFWETMRVIDGTRTVRAHGDSDMPVWGQIFRDESEWGLARRAEVQGKLTFLTDYIRSIQQEK